jgi:4-hydroxybenzoate polyprenyltransferase
MWKAILFLCSVPIALGLLILSRVAGGNPAVSEKELRFLFGDNKEMTLSFWMGLQFTVFSVLFFIAGVVESLIFINLGGIWLVMVPLVTGLGAILFLMQWIRWGSREKRASQHNTAPSYARQHRTPGIQT